MRVLLVGAGASFSTKDVETGYFEALRDLGVETHLYLLDARITIAFKWVKFMWKYGHKSDPNTKPTWADAIYRAGIEALEMALRYQVDWVVAVSAMYFHPDVIVMMRRAGLRVAVLFTESPYEDKKQLKVAQLVNTCFMNERTSETAFREVNPNSFYLAHAYNPRATAVLSPVRAGFVTNVTLEPHEVVFVGSGFKERIELLGKVDWKEIDLALYGIWTLMHPKDHLRKYIKGNVVHNAEALQLYQKAEIGLNIHRKSVTYDKHPEYVEGAESLNPRAFELAASGTFCLTDYRKEGFEIFDKTQPVFDSASDLGDMVRWFLKNPGWREIFARQARERVQGHTYQTRAKELLWRLSTTASAA